MHSMPAIFHSMLSCTLRCKYLVDYLLDTVHDSIITNMKAELMGKEMVRFW